MRAGYDPYGVYAVSISAFWVAVCRSFIIKMTAAFRNGSLDAFLRANDNGSMGAGRLVRMMTDIASGMKYLTVNERQVAICQAQNLGE